MKENEYFDFLLYTIASSIVISYIFKFGYIKPINDNWRIIDMDISFGFVSYTFDVVLVYMSTLFIIKIINFDILK